MSNKLYKLNSEVFGNKAPKINPEVMQGGSAGHSRFAFDLPTNFTLKGKAMTDIQMSLRQVTHALVVADLASAMVDLTVKDIFKE